MFQCIHSCCYCLSLRAGTLIIGYTFSVLCVGATIVGRGAALVKEIPSKESPQGGDHEKKLQSIRTHGIWVVAVSLVYLFFCVSLVISAHRHLRQWHIPWMVATLVVAIIILSTSFGDLATWLVAIPTNFVLLYCLMVVYSRYIQMGLDDDPDYS